MERGYIWYPGVAGRGGYPIRGRRHAETKTASDGVVQVQLVYEIIRNSRDPGVQDHRECALQKRDHRREINARIRSGEQDRVQQVGTAVAPMHVLHRMMGM